MRTVLPFVFVLYFCLPFKAYGGTVCTDAGGVDFHSACWFVGQSGQSCDTVCTNHSMSYDPVTCNWAGASSGNCSSLGAVFGGTKISPASSIFGAIGCFRQSLLRTKTLRTPDCVPSASSYSVVERYCACLLSPPPESCCFDDASPCQDLTPTACSALPGGNPQGVGTQCATTVCDAAEACCIPGVGCDDLTPAACAAAGGVAQGPATDCATTECPESCCFDDASPCQDLTPTACSALPGGNPQGVGTQCATTVCAEAQACCIPGVGCQDLTPAACTAAGGVSQGAGTDCTTTECPGACCNTYTTDCTYVTPTACNAAAGVFQGPGTPCTPDPCPAQYDGCCLTYGSSYCTDNLSEDECLGQSGSFQGWGSSCSVTAGACCAGYRCKQEIFDDCIAGGGIAMGGPCTPGLCPAAVPTAGGWMLLILALLLGGAAYIVIRRRRPDSF